MDWPITYRRKVRFSDSDAQGIVFNGNYMTYFDDAVTDWFDAAGLAWTAFVDAGYEMVLAHVDMDFRAPGRLGDVLITGVRVERIGSSSVTFALRTWNEATGDTVVEGREIQVIVDAVTFRPAPVPGIFTDAVANLQGGVPAG